MMNMLFQISCDLGSLLTTYNTNINWININALIVILVVTIAAALYAIANLLPGRQGERLKAMMRYEMFEAFVSIIILIILIALSASVCNIGAALVGQTAGYEGVYSFANNYIGNLLFTNGLSTVSNIYSTSIQLTVASNIFAAIAAQWQAFTSSVLTSLPVIGGIAGSVQIEPALTIDSLFRTYSTVLTSAYSSMLLITFAPLFLVFLMLPIIGSTALTVILPVSIAMRSLSIVGPKIREASNIFLSLAIGFYFIFPLMIVFNAYVASCVNILVIPGAVPGCPASSGAPVYPLSQYIGDYPLPTTASNLFSGAGQSFVLCGTGSTLPNCNGLNGPNCCNLNSVPIPFGNNPNLNIFQGFFGSLSTLAPADFVINAFGTLVTAPNIAVSIGDTIAGYVFLGVFMIALDLAVTVGFINGLSKGLNSISALFGLEPFFGD